MNYSCIFKCYRRTQRKPPSTCPVGTHMNSHVLGEGIEPMSQGVPKYATRPPNLANTVD
ncbi:hypothetical protein DPMN_150029 [Dreissena polymorpha]|uniref:Uncharacterized protein n=1 Tax=Dreissena polymorpha TaxID=45954 RepID=A0A9D4J1N3_DREPO|nr:hypothetical protein DPMN_150029 [Dreissena polymorpha]